MIILIIVIILASIHCIFMFRSKITISTKNINKMFQICKKMTISKKESKKDEKSINLLFNSV